MGMMVWLGEQRRGMQDLPGDVWGGGRFLVGATVCLLMFLAGIGVMTGMLDRERMGFHVPMVVGVTVGLQLLVLVGCRDCVAGERPIFERIRPFSKTDGLAGREVGWWGKTGMVAHSETGGRSALGRRWAGIL